MYGGEIEDVRAHGGFRIASRTYSVGRIDPTVVQYGVI